MGHDTPVSDQVSDNGTEHSGISVPGPGRLATGKIIKRAVRGASGRRGLRNLGHPDEHNAYPDQYDRAARTMSIFTTARGRFVT